MALEYAQWFYDSNQWKKTRKSFIAYRISIDGGMCERCKERVGYIVHHKEYITPDNINNPDITLSFNNLEYVCLDCHNKEHKSKSERYYFDDDGNMIWYSPPLASKLKK